MITGKERNPEATSYRQRVDPNGTIVDAVVDGLDDKYITVWGGCRSNPCCCIIPALFWAVCLPDRINALSITFVA